MENKFNFSQAYQSGGSPHDYFGRKTVGDPLIAADLLRNYADPVIAEHVDLDHLISEPTHFFGPAYPQEGPKEVILDVPYIAHLHDATWKSDVLIVIEHKSSPNLFVPLQLGVHANLFLYKRWTDAGRPTSRKKFNLPIPLMVLLYCGAEDLPDEPLHFQDIFEHVPDSLKAYVLQFRLLVINLRRFGYGHLRGRPETQAVVETMKRAFDGTLAEHFPGVLGRFGGIPIDDRIMDLIGSIAWYSGRIADITPQRIVEAITNVIKGKEGVEMAETIQKGIWTTGFEAGEARGEAREIRGRVEDILLFLESRFGTVSQSLQASLNGMTDIPKLRSLLLLSSNCSSLDEFEAALR